MILKIWIGGSKQQVSPPRLGDDAVVPCTGNLPMSTHFAFVSPGPLDPSRCPRCPSLQLDRILVATKGPFVSYILIFCQQTPNFKKNKHIFLSVFSFHCTYFFPLHNPHAVLKHRDMMRRKTNEIFKKMGWTLRNGGACHCESVFFNHITKANQLNILWIYHVIYIINRYKQAFPTNHFIYIYIN